jgi:hypothetical protein
VGRRNKGGRERQTSLVRALVGRVLFGVSQTEVVLLRVFKLYLVVVCINICVRDVLKSTKHG